MRNAGFDQIVPVEGQVQQPIALWKALRIALTDTGLYLPRGRSSTSSRRRVAAQRAAARRNSIAARYRPMPATIAAPLPLVEIDLPPASTPCRRPTVRHALTIPTIHSRFALEKRNPFQCRSASPGGTTR